MATPLRPPGAPKGRFRHPGRVVLVVAIFAVAVSLVAIAIDSTDTTTEAEDPISAVETVVPGPGEILQDAITADLRVNLTGVLVIDGVEVAEDQTDRVVALGQVSFRPGPGNDIVRFQPGTHTVTVLFWERGKERPASPESYTWTFRSVS